MISCEDGLYDDYMTEQINLPQVNLRGFGYLV